ncbi:hypothetical protein ACI68E_003273 [Malassezia pachydermatis]|uniref:Gamm1 protein n=1 Tax=Malassezia pachydermatis TaxID=77020 RepID=A0A0M8MUU3_9BASI|nr:hypothetical protein Malapachy_4082 [Malassezia pachydermatis]KOS14051.1 hypothetical protein Malapachy_4082 [Malassezia pachydermatis]
MSDAKRIKLSHDARPVIVTHSGTFHADEALAVHLLYKLPVLRDAELIRTRDAAEIAKGTIVVDVGAEYVPEQHRYDHHQRGFFETFDDEHKTKLSSAGLVWKHFGRDILAAHLNTTADDERVPILYKKMYDDFVEAIDAIDNGIALYPDVEGPPAYRSRTDLSSRVGYLNPRWNETWDDADLLKRFRRASELAGTEFFERVDDAVEAWLPARQLVIDALNQRKSFEGADAQGRIVLFERIVAWKSHIFNLEEELAIPDNEKPLYIVYADEAGKWRVQAVPVNPESFESRRALPEPWRGIRDEELSQLTGIPGCIFVHQSGFIGGHQTKEGALALATKALAM